MSTNIKIVIIFFIAFLNNSCNTTEPIDNLQPGRRDYVWTVDTLYLPFNPFTDMTGSSPSDVWVCGPGDADKIFYHYDGQVWKSDQVQRTFSPLSINSLNSNEVWSCGFLGKIWTFNGTHWIEFYSYSPKVDTSIILQEIRGFSTSSIYAVGQYFLGAQIIGKILFTLW